MNAAFELRILGAPQLVRSTGDGMHAVHLSPRCLAVLAYMASASPARVTRRDTLLGLFWPDLDEAHARNCLSQILHRLRSELDPELVASRGADELWISRETLWCDVVAFEEAFSEGRLAEGLGLYREPLLSGLHVRDAPGFEHWLETKREHLRLQASEAAIALSDREAASGNLSGASSWLRRRVDLSPDDESSARRLMDLLNQLGDRSGALRVYETLARNLAEEFDLSPSPEIQNLAERLRGTEGPSTGSVGKRVPSVAVLPFANLSGDADQAYFCDGITEEIINVLAQIGGLRVSARTSVFALKHQTLDALSLAQRLGVDAVIEGTVRRAGDRLRISAQLVNASDGYHLWSDRFDRAPHDVFAIQDEIAESVATALRVELLRTPNPRRAPRHTLDTEAHALYLRGLFHRRKRTQQDLEKACECLEGAVERDSNYAQAHAALAFTYSLCGWFPYDVLPPRQAYVLARKAASKALSLDDGLAEAHLADGFIRNAFEWDGPGAEVAFQRALSLDPDNQDTIGSYASFLVSRGRFDEAIAMTERAEKLDPLWIMPRIGIGIWHFAARRYDQALARLLQADEMEPRLYAAPLFLGDAYRFSGRLDEAASAYQRVLDLIGRGPIILGRLGALAAAQNRPDAARTILKELSVISQTRHVLPSIVARVHLAMGDHDRGLLWLEKACKQRDTTLTLLRTWPDYDDVRSHPRFQRLLKEVGLVDQSSACAS